ncbi:DUF421 domain-containing protein [Luteimonas yindakuii]|uniref:DUF421 domain-containing protein n=1 Tax=Luteimonas yindakuii TaxID=2565782 RepID=A0A4Z1RLZ0_9GAMM|nr:YetF domain-containing protein [Luteimonas yindakuii]QCO66591.1 DUF421 domain-containing protein [Luteimonas yindakuii]TKS55119.1 DUF421 domain-containing protein [Luteimonas yindakuii]
MEGTFGLQTPIWEIVLRASVVYLGLALVLRVVPKRQTGNLAPNDILALVVIGSIAASAVLGEATSTLDLMLKILVIVLWDYLFNLAEYHFPRFRRVAQDTPTLLIHEGQVLEDNLRREKLTDEELAAALRGHGIDDLRDVRQAVLEVDGRISVIRRDQHPAP